MKNLKEKNNEWRKNLERFITYSINIIFFLIIGLLTLFSIFETTYIEKEELSEYYKDNMIVHIIIILLIIIIICGIKLIKKKIKIFIKNKNYNKDKIKKYINLIKTAIVILVVIGWGLVCIRWIFITKFYPRADQNYTLESAEQIKNNDYKSLEPKGYLYMYPQQKGLALLEYFLIGIFNKETYIIMQIINVISLLISILCMYLITKLISNKINSARLVVLLIITFIPISLYITFVYGNLIGFACSMLAVVFELLYLKNEKKRYILPMAICIAFAVIIKSNYLINLIAMILLLISNAILKKKIKYIVPLLCIVIFYIIGGKLCNVIIKDLTNKQINTGMPSTAWIAMGMQEGYMAPGWYNSYSKKTFESFDYNTEETDKEAKKNIKSRLKEFKNNPKYAINFYWKKIESQWNNPTFQGFWIYNNRKSNVKQKKIVKKILVGDKTNKYICNYLNYFQTAVLVGALIYSTVNFRKIKLNNMILVITIIGGFLFHIIWEAKAQYTITYFILLIPYAVMGYNDICENLVKFYNKRLKKLKSN